jgi:hypothetical protein
MNLGVLGRHRHHLAAAEGDGTDIAILDALRLRQTSMQAWLISSWVIGNLHAQRLRPI